MPESGLESGARRICAVLRDAGHRALFAGGCVRDRMMGVVPSDYDIATSAPPAGVMALFPRTVPVGVDFGTVLVILPEGPYEVTTFRNDGPYLDGRHPSGVVFTGEREDAQRRDFTVNALFLDPETDAVIDYVGGVADLEAGVLRAVGDPGARFAEDHLRLLRAVRFSARLGFSMEASTFRAVVENRRALAAFSSMERIRDELVKMLTGGTARRAFELLDETGLLGVVLPEVAAMKGVEQPPQFHPEGDVLTHTLQMLALLPKDCTVTLAMGALLHDAGKPATQTHEDRIRFNFHQKRGAVLARELCARLRFSNAETGRIVWLVAQHMRVAAFPEMREAKRRAFAAEEGFDELLTLARMDCLASHGDLSTLEWIENYLGSLAEGPALPPPLVTGDDLKAMGLAPGPVFREILNAVREKQLEGGVKDRGEALGYVKKYWAGMK